MLHVGRNASGGKTGRKSRVQLQNGQVRPEFSHTAMEVAFVVMSHKRQHISKLKELIRGGNKLLISVNCKTN